MVTPPCCPSWECWPFAPSERLEPIVIGNGAREPQSKALFMRVQNHDQVPASEVTMEGAAGCRVRWLIGEGDKAPNFAMREFEVAPGGHTPKHFHDYEHEVYVLAGRGTIIDGDAERPLAAGDVV